MDLKPALNNRVRLKLLLCCKERVSQYSTCFWGLYLSTHPHLPPLTSMLISTFLCPLLTSASQTSFKWLVMDGTKVGGRDGGAKGGKVVVGHEEDVGDGMYCNDHPYRSNPGGICAFCLQEKLGKLVSSSIPLPIRASSSSSSPSFRSDISGVGNTSLSLASSSSSSLSLSIRPTSAQSVRDSGGDCHYHGRARIPFLLAKRKQKVTASSSSSSDRTTEIVLKRSKSTTTTHRRGSFLDLPDVDSGYSPRRRYGFWSFLYLSSSKLQSSKKVDQSLGVSSMAAAESSCSVGKQKDRFFPSLGTTGAIEEEEEESPNSQATASASSFERKVSRSRSVGCGSRSFSGDFFERISTGFGDCTLRRVESQREGKPRVPSSSAIKDRVKCGGIFGGFMLTSSSSSSSASASSYWVSSSAEDINGGKASSITHGGRNKSWGWAFASPMRAFSKSSSKDGKRVAMSQDSNKNSTTTTPDLSAIPSLLAVRS